MSAFAWTFVESLHVYRMLTEVRNIDTGPMRFYYVVGWGLPAVVTGEAGAGGCDPGAWRRRRGGPGAGGPARPHGSRLLSEACADPGCPWFCKPALSPPSLPRQVGSAVDVGPAR